MGTRAKGKGQRAKGSPARPAPPTVIAAGRADLACLCRVALEQVTQAESLTMAEWLRLRPDGRTLRAAYAEAAGLAHELTMGMNERVLPGSAGVPPAGSARLSDARSGRDARAPRQRERRPVLVLTRELRECLERVEAWVERGEPLPAGAEETLVAVDALVAGDR